MSRHWGLPERFAVIAALSILTMLLAVVGGETVADADAQTVDVLRFAFASLFVIFAYLSLGAVGAWMTQFQAAGLSARGVRWYYALAAAGIVALSVVVGRGVYTAAPELWRVQVLLGVGFGGILGVRAVPDAWLARIGRRLGAIEEGGDA